jgi:hypothetical protein
MELGEIDRQSHMILAKITLYNTYRRPTKNGQDIAVSIRDLALKDWSPPLAPGVIGRSLATEAAVKVTEQVGLAITFQAELERYLKKRYS